MNTQAKNKDGRSKWRVISALMAIVFVSVAMLTQLVSSHASPNAPPMIAQKAAGVIGGTATPTPTNTPLPSATPCFFNPVFNEDFESGTLGLFTSTAIITSTTTPVPTPGWASVASNPHSGTNSAFAPAPDRTTDARLTTIFTFFIPAGVSTATLTFWHRFAFENRYDGGVLEVSTDDGINWADADTNIQQGVYNGTIIVDPGCMTAGTPPPFPSGKRVWTSSQTTYGQVMVNLLPYQGNFMKFRFRLGTDCGLSTPGWNVDDVVVSYMYACASATVTASPAVSTMTAMATNTLISTPVLTATNTAIRTSTALHTSAPTTTPNNTFTNTPTKTPIRTATPSRTGTRSPIPSPSSSPTACLSPTSTPTATTCTITFSDVPPGHTFYSYIHCLACRAIISGYADGTFRPNNSVTRGQISKMIANADLVSDPVPSTQQTFTDVPPTNPFWLFVERLANHLYLSGYPCGGPGEPCDPQNRPYFRWGNNVTRGQIAKIDTNTAAYTDAIPSTQQTFTDVPSSNPFWLFIERAAINGVLGGYPCGGPGEP